MMRRVMMLAVLALAWVLALGLAGTAAAAGTAGTAGTVGKQDATPDGLGIVDANRYHAPGYPSLTIADDYEFMGCEDRSGEILDSLSCRFLKRSPRDICAGAALRISADTVNPRFGDLRDKLHEGAHVVAFHDATCVYSLDPLDEHDNRADVLALDDRFCKLRLILYDVLDARRMQMIFFEVGLGTLQHQTLEGEWPLETMLRMLDQAVVRVDR